jgi:sugar lactone lactonase YvrE
MRDDQWPDLHFEVPTRMPAMVAFGSPNEPAHYIASGRGEAWMRYQVTDAAGSRFAVEPNFRGVPGPSFTIVEGRRALILNPLP